MHGPDGSHYRNESVFTEIQPPHRVVIHHTSEPRFTLTITLATTETGTDLSWLQEFEQPDVASRLAHILRPANEQNLDRLTAEVLRQPSD